MGGQNQFIAHCALCHHGFNRWKGGMGRKYMALLNGLFDDVVYIEL